MAIMTTKHYLTLFSPSRCDQHLVYHAHTNIRKTRWPTSVTLCPGDELYWHWFFPLAIQLQVNTHTHTHTVLANIVHRQSNMAIEQISTFFSCGHQIDMVNQWSLEGTKHFYYYKMHVFIGDDSILDVCLPFTNGFIGNGNISLVCGHWSITSFFKLITLKWQVCMWSLPHPSKPMSVPSRDYRPKNTIEKEKFASKSKSGSWL